LDRNARADLIQGLLRCAARLRQSGLQVFTLRRWLPGDGRGSSAFQKKRGELLGIGGVYTENHPRAPPGLLDRVTDIAGDGRQGFCRQAVC